MIQAGDRIPSAALTAVGPDGARETTTDEVFGGKRVVLFGVPGAFTPTCTNRHLPTYLEHGDSLRAKGVDLIACVSVNDQFVMGAWARHEGVGDGVLMLADGSGAFVRALGLEQDMSARGMGMRSQRFALVARDGVVERVSVEQPGEFGVSGAEAVLAGL